MGAEAAFQPTEKGEEFLAGLLLPCSAGMCAQEDRGRFVRSRPSCRPVEPG